MKEADEQGEVVKMESGERREQLVAACWDWIGSALEWDHDEGVWQLDPGESDPIKSAANDRLRHQATSIWEHEAQCDLTGPGS